MKLTNIFETIKNKDKTLLNNFQAKNTFLLSSTCRKEELKWVIFYLLIIIAAVVFIAVTAVLFQSLF